MATQHTEPIFRGPINGSRRKGELREISDAIAKFAGIPQQAESATRDDLAKAIQAQLKTHQAMLYCEPEFQLLYKSHAPAAPKVKKSSADRAIEDDAASKNPVNETAAHKQLVEHGISQDPPAQFAPLSLGKNKHEGHAAEESSGDEELAHGSGDEGKDEGTGDGEFDEMHGKMRQLNSSPADPPSLPNKPKMPVPTMPDNVVVVVHDIVDTTTGPLEVWLESGTQTGDLFYEQDPETGDVQWGCHLSDVLPAVLEQETPMKRRGGHLFRDGVVSGGHRIPLGSVEKILAGTSTVLKAERVDFCNMTVEDGLARCDIFYQPPPLAALPHDGPTGYAPGVPNASGPGHQHTVEAQPASASGFLDFLKEVLKIDDVPATVATNMGDVLVRAKRIHETFDKFKQMPLWTKRRAGYQVPSNSAQFAGKHFTKEDVFKALGYTKSVANGDLALFDPQVLEHVPKVKKWFDNPEHRYAKRFAKMTVSQMKAYQQKHQSATKNQDISSEDEVRHSKSSGKRRAVVDSDDAGRQKRSRKHKTIHSDGLDDSH